MRPLAPKNPVSTWTFFEWYRFVGPDHCYQATVEHIVTIERYRLFTSLTAASRSRRFQSAHGRHRMVPLPHEPAQCYQATVEHIVTIEWYSARFSVRLASRVTPTPGASWSSTARLPGPHILLVPRGLTPRDSRDDIYYWRLVVFRTILTPRAEGWTLSNGTASSPACRRLQLRRQLPLRLQLHVRYGILWLQRRWTLSNGPASSPA